jgi:uncharacterized sulfatase
MKRREFLQSTAAVTGGLLSGLSNSRAAETTDAVPGPQPNILFILVDELRYPTVFPGDIQTPDQFLRRFMPNVHKLWTKGVKFGNYHTAANACTPSRGVLMTGLYSQQNWLLSTILSTPYPPSKPTRQPVLNPAYPTWGKLLQAANYQTPYTGKWHVSVPYADKGGLTAYGYDFFTYYDPTGDNLQGTYGDEIRGYHNDSYSAGQAVDWLLNKRPTNQPWCLTCSLVNPHDREFFPAGTEFKTVNKIFKDKNINPNGYDQLVDYPGNGPDVSWQENALKSPPNYKYPALPPNWESRETLLANKPTTHTFVHDLQQGIWGGISDVEGETQPTIDQYPNPNQFEDLNLGIVKMPFDYWKRGFDSYTQVMQIVDNDIGGLLDAFETLPKRVTENTIIIFAADHGEYSGAHGMVQGKLGTCYEEAWHIPLIVVDPSHRFTGDIDTIRTGLVSSVDFMPMITSLGYRGTRDWMMSDDLATIYGGRHDVISMLKSAKAPGRPYVLYATDEIIPLYYNYLKAPLHVLGYRTENTKLGVYAKWPPLKSTILPKSVQLEFYDHTTTNGALELDNSANSDPRVWPQYQNLLNDIIPNELQALLPGQLGKEQQKSKIAHLLFRDFIAVQPSGAWKNGGLTNILGYGANF